MVHDFFVVNTLELYFWDLESLQLQLQEHQHSLLSVRAECYVRAVDFLKYVSEVPNKVEIDFCLDEVQFTYSKKLIYFAPSSSSSEKLYVQFLEE